jgi:CPA1 family monovalent cation:H+ antiporter
MLGLGIARAIRRVDDPMLEIALTTIAAYGSFALAEELHVSGVLATVVTGMACARKPNAAGASAQTHAVDSFWEYVGFALNSIVFLLIGFESGIVSLFKVGREIALVFIAMLAARAIVVGLLALVQQRTSERWPRGWATVLTWGGLRGALSLVLALALPASTPGRETLISITVGAVGLSLIVQGFSMPYLIEWLGIATPSASTRDADLRA